MAGFIVGYSLRHSKDWPWTGIILLLANLVDFEILCARFTTRFANIKPALASSASLHHIVQGDNDSLGSTWPLHQGNTTDTQSSPGCDKRLALGRSVQIPRQTLIAWGLGPPDTWVSKRTPRPRNGSLNHNSQEKAPGIRKGSGLASMIVILLWMLLGKLSYRKPATWSLSVFLARDDLNQGQTPHWGVATTKASDIVPKKALRYGILSENSFSWEPLPVWFKGAKNIGKVPEPLEPVEDGVDATMVAKVVVEAETGPKRTGREDRGPKQRAGPLNRIPTSSRVPPTWWKFNLAQ